MDRVDPDFMRQVRKLGAPDASACYSCGTCTATCPLKVTVKDGRITHIANHPEYLCDLGRNLTRMIPVDEYSPPRDLMPEGQSGSVKCPFNVPDKQTDEMSFDRLAFKEEFTVPDHYHRLFFHLHHSILPGIHCPLVFGDCM